MVDGKSLSEDVVTVQVVIPTDQWVQLRELAAKAGLPRETRNTVLRWAVAQLLARENGGQEDG